MVKMHQRQVMIELTDDEIETLKYVVTLEKLNSQSTVEQVMSTSILEIVLAPFLEEEE